MDLPDQLQKLHSLREQGVLTEDEFILAKKRVLEGNGSHSFRQSDVSGAPSVLNEFRLSTTNKWIGGVCGGLASLTNVPAWTWRILFLLTALLHGIGVLVYILLWIFVPIQTHAVEASRMPADEKR